MAHSIKEKLAAGEIVTIVNVNYPAPALVERLAVLGFDIAFVDCEKGAHTAERIEEMGRAGRAGGIATIARPWINDAGLISRYLDLGVDGLMLPTIEDADTARALVEAVRYARPHDHAQKIVVATVESPAGLAALPGMLAVDGIDIWSIGINDLAHRMGHPGNAAHPDVQAMLSRTIRQIVDHGCVCATVAPPESARQLVAQGVRGLITNINALLASGARTYHEAWR